MSLFKLVSLGLFFSVFSVTAQAIESVTIASDTGDTLMIHRLNNGEIWGSLMITDQVPDSFDIHELIVLQVDQFKPIKLDQEKRCGTPAGMSQKVDYSFDIANDLTSKVDNDSTQWQFSQVESTNSNKIKFTGWDKETYDHMKSDRRPEVVDFPIQGAIAIASLWQQFQQGELVTFRYTTDVGEARTASFELNATREQVHGL